MVQQEVMSKRKNIYVDDEALPRLDRFESSGGNSSELFKKALADWERETAEEDERRKVAAGEYGRIVVEVSSGPAGLLERKAFTGRWLFEPSHETEASENRFDAGCYWGVAETKKGAIVVVITNDPEGDPERFEVYGHVSDFKASESVPENIRALALIALGDDYVEELDI